MQGEEKQKKGCDIFITDSSFQRTEVFGKECPTRKILAKKLFQNAFVI